MNRRVRLGIFLGGKPQPREKGATNKSANKKAASLIEMFRSSCLCPIDTLKPRVEASGTVTLGVPGGVVRPALARAAVLVPANRLLTNSTQSSTRTRNQWQRQNRRVNARLKR